MTAPDDDVTGLTARRWVLMAGGWSLLLVPWLVVAATLDAPLLLRIALVLVVAVYAACYVGGLLAALRRGSPAFSAALLVLMALLWVAMVAGLSVEPAVTGPVLYTVSFLLAAVLALLPPVPGTVTALLVAGSAALLLHGLAGTVAVPDLVGVLAVTVAMAGMFGVVRANASLRAARGELARLAVVRERERMTRDLHDVLGHSLTSITVKAALVRRLLESGAVDRARAEAADVEQLGRQALADVRATVAANRVTSLPAELAGAREALDAAGITADLPSAVDDVPPERQEVFAFVLREGVTNVVRHSGAGRCTVRLDAASLEVVDDGPGERATGAVGNGLRGLAERAAAIGARVAAGPRPDGGYRLRVECAGDP